MYVFYSMHGEPNGDSFLNQKVKCFFLCVLVGPACNFELFHSGLVLTYYCLFSFFKNRASGLDSAEEYKMDNKQRGLALIVTLDDTGNNADCDNLEKRYHFPASCWRGNTVFMGNCVI